MKVSLYLDIGRVLALGEFVQSDRDRESEAKLEEGLHRAAEEFNRGGYSHKIPSFDNGIYFHSGENGFRRADFRKVDVRMLKMRNVSIGRVVQGRR